MRICILSEYFYPDCLGGTGAVMSSLVRCLYDSNDDLEIDVIAGKNFFRGEGTSLPAHENWDGVNILRVNAPKPRKNSVRRRLAANMMFTTAAFRKLLAGKKRYDLVLVVTAPATLPMAAQAYSRVTGTPYIYLVHDLFLDMAIAMNLVSAESRVVRRMNVVQKGWLQASSKVVVLGRCMRDFVATKYDLPAHQLEVVPIHSNVEGITPLKTPSQFRVGNGLDGFVVLYAGNFARYQDFDTLLDAAKLLKDRSDITFVFVGDGAKKEDIQGRVEQEELHNVRMFPFVEEEQLCDLLNAADVSLVTLESGAAGLAVPSKFYNIMASGRATVAVTDPSSEVAQVIKEANCGVQVDPENAPQLAQVLAHLADSPDAVAAMGRNARHECEKKYSLESVARQYYDLFGRVAQQRMAGRRWKFLSKQRKARLDMQVTGVAPETVSGAVEGEAEAIREPARFSLLSLINR